MISFVLSDISVKCSKKITSVNVRRIAVFAQAFKISRTIIYVRM